MDPITYTTPGGIGIRREALTANYADGASPLISALDSRRGVLLSSSFEYPGRYTRWDIGFVDPPVEITAKDRSMRIRALNDRGRVLVSFVAPLVGGIAVVEDFSETEDDLTLRISEPSRVHAASPRIRRKKSAASGMTQEGVVNERTIASARIRCPSA